MNACSPEVTSAMAAFEPSLCEDTKGLKGSVGKHSGDIHRLVLRIRRLREILSVFFISNEFIL